MLMKSITNNYLTVLFFIFSNVGFTACDGGNTGNKDTQIDSTKLYDEYAYHPEASINEDSLSGNYLGEVTTRNAVKVDIDLERFDWETFRKIYHIQDDSQQPESSVTENVAVGSWAQWGDEYSYQRVYRNFNNELWLQTYIRRDDESGRANINTNLDVLTIEGSDSLKLSQLWVNMEEHARTLQDSLNIQN